MTKYLLDSDVIIHYLNKRILIDKNILQCNLSISIITYAEITYGHMKSINYQKRHNNFINFLKDFNIKIIQTDIPIIEEYLKIRIELESNGIRLENFDLIIAGTAISKNLELVTYNLKHFRRINNLKIYASN